MPESSGTFWSWLAARHVTDCWQPERFRPEYIELERALSQMSGLAPLQDFVEFVAPSESDSQSARWHADSEGIRRRVADNSDPSESSLTSIALPEEAILVSRHWFQEPKVHYWNENIFRGHGTASSHFLVLRSRSDRSVAWLVNELIKPEAMLQIRRASAGTSLPNLSHDALMKVRVRCLSVEEQREANGAVRDGIKSEVSQLHLKTLRKPFLLTGQTFEERLTQFEQFLSFEGLFPRGDVYFVEPSTNSKESDLFAIRPTDSEAMTASATEFCVPELDLAVNSRWRRWFWDESPAESHRIFNTLASDDELPGHLLLRAGVVSLPPVTFGERFLFPRFSAFRQAVLPSVQADVGVEDQVWADTWSELQRSFGCTNHPAIHVQTDKNASQEAVPNDVEQKLFDWARRIYRPVLGLKVWRGDSIAGAYLLFGDDQTRNYLAVYSRLDEIGIALADVLRPQSELIEDATRRESLRRLSWVMHQLNGPVGRANSALQDIQQLLNGQPSIGSILVPNDETARQRAAITGSVLAQQTLSARLQDAMKAVADVRKIAYQVRRLRRVQGEMPRARLELTRLLADRARSCCGQLSGLRVDYADTDITVDGNLESIREAIDEVLSNACREFRERSVDDPRICLRCWTERGSAWFSITDNALPAGARLIPDPFEEDSSTYASSGRGTGLGLAIVRETFRAHRGGCSLTENVFENERAPGVTFVAHLPLSQPNPQRGAD